MELDDHGHKFTSTDFDSSIENGLDGKPLPLAAGVLLAGVNVQIDVEAVEGIDVGEIPRIHGRVVHLSEIDCVGLGTEKLSDYGKGEERGQAAANEPSTALWNLSR